MENNIKNNQEGGILETISKGKKFSRLQLAFLIGAVVLYVGSSVLSQWIDPIVRSMMVILSGVVILVLLIGKIESASSIVTPLRTTRRERYNKYPILSFLDIFSIMTSFWIITALFLFTIDPRIYLQAIILLMFMLGTRLIFVFNNDFVLKRISQWLTAIVPVIILVYMLLLVQYNF